MNIIGRLSNDGLDGTHYELKRLRQRMKALAFCLSVRGFVRPPIRQALASDALKQFVGASTVIHTKAATVVIAEIEFRQIAVKMLFANMVIGAVHAALENRKIILGGVDVNEAAEARIFVCRMVHGAMAIEFFAEVCISGVFVGHQI